MSSRKSSSSSSKEEDEVPAYRHRRRSYFPRKHSVIDELNRVITQRKKSTDTSDEDISDVQPWLKKLHRKGPYAVKDGKFLHRVSIPEDFYGMCSAKYSPDGRVIATAFGAGAIQIRKAEDGSLLHTVRKHDSQNIPAMSLHFHPQRQDVLFAASASGSIFMCTQQEDQHQTFAHEQNNEVNSIDVSSKGRILVSGGKDAVLRAYDLNTAKLLLSYPSLNSQKTKIGMKEHAPYHKSRIFAIKFHPDRENIFLSGGWDDVVKVWDLRINDVKACVANIRGPHICGEAIDIRGNTVLTGSWTATNSIQIWDLGSAKAIDTIIPHNRPQTIDGEFLYCAQFIRGDISGDTILTGGSGTALVEAINIAEKKIICYFKLNKTILTIDNYCDRVVFGGMQNYFGIAEYTGIGQLTVLNGDRWTNTTYCFT